MAKCDLSIHLDDDKTSYRGGDTVTGTVEVRTDAEVQCKALTVECQWRTHGKGNTARGRAQRLDLAQGIWPPGAIQRYAFSFELPHGPFTYHGHYLNIGWFIRAQADIPWALDPKAEQEIGVEPNPGQEPEWANLVHRMDALPEALRAQIGAPAAPLTPQALRVSSALGYGCLSIIVIPLLLITMFGLYHGISLLRNGGDWIEAALWIGVPLFVLAGLARGPLAVLLGTLRNRWAGKRLQDIDFDVTPLTLRRGESVQIRFSCRPDQNTVLNRATVRIEAEERVTQGSGTSRRTHRKQVYSHEEDLPMPHSLSAGLPFQREIEVTIPADAPPSFIAVDNRLDWTIRLQLDIPRWPDWSGERAILIHP
jgi:hypothetical protein